MRQAFQSGKSGPRIAFEAAFESLKKLRARFLLPVTPGPRNPGPEIYKSSCGQCPAEARPR